MAHESYQNDEHDFVADQDTVTLTAGETSQEVPISRFAMLAAQRQLIPDSPEWHEALRQAKDMALRDIRAKPTCSTT